MTQFLPAQIFSVSMLAYGSRATCFDLRASLFGFQTDFSGVEEDRMGCGKVACGLRRPFGVEVGTRAPPCRAARDGLARGPTLKRAARPFPFIFAFFLHVSPLGPHFAPTYSFAHILQSETPIDDPFSPTRSTSKHLLILTILFSFERSECAATVILIFMSFCLFLAIQDSDRRSVFAYTSYKCAPSHPYHPFQF